MAPENHGATRCTQFTTLSISGQTGWGSNPPELPIPVQNPSRHDADAKLGNPRLVRNPLPLGTLPPLHPFAADAPGPSLADIETEKV